MKSYYTSIIERYTGTPCGPQYIFPLSFPTLTSRSFFPYSNVFVVNADTLDTAIAKPGSLLLNMGNPTIPGGNPWIVGAQEEDLFRRTNLHRYLTQDLYPIHKKIILSKQVEVVSAGLRQEYTPLPEPNYVDIITCSAIQNFNIGTTMNSIDTHKMIQKICTLFEVAYKEGYKRFVLSAFGCGGFRCPPEHVSQLFQKALDVYADKFEEIIFAIWDEAYPKSNFAIFRKTLTGVE
jgi:uncharacterized protein (TIGR02452 family)